jgi:hypothetical protein
VVSKRSLPLFAFGNVAVGVIAIGNVAYGVVAIGFAISVGVVAIGMNAVGAFAFGLNALGPISVGIINSFGTLAWAGVNALGGYTVGLVNNGESPIFGGILAILALLVAEGISRLRTPREQKPRTTIALAALLDASGDVSTEARLVRDGDQLVLVDGETRIAVTGDDALAGKRVVAKVKIVEEFTDTGAYREAPEKQRRYVVEDATEVTRPPWIASRDDLHWTFARAMQLSAACALAVLIASYYGER